MRPMNLGVNPGSEQRAVPFNQAASDAREALTRALRVYALRVAVATGRPAPHGPVAHARYLSTQLPTIRDDAASISGIFSAIVGASDKARRAVDRPVERKYVGVCDCGASLYATDGAEQMGCRKCGQTWGVQARRDWLLEQAKNQVGTPEVLARLLPWFDERPVKASTIRQWASRGKLRAAGPGSYRIGDVIALHRASTPLDLVA